jgi:methyltransferase family protein
MFAIVRAFEPACGLELGTALGISAAYQVLGMKLNGRGRLTTIEGAEELARIADETCTASDGTVCRCSRAALRMCCPICCDRAHRAGLHRWTPRSGRHEAYFELIHPFLPRHAVLVIDDIRWSGGMRAAWKEIRSDPRVKCAVDLDQWGICLLDKGVVGPRSSYAITI